VEPLKKAGLPHYTFRLTYTKIWQVQKYINEECMPKIKLVISDLHLAGGHPIFDSFGDLQHTALEGFLNAVSSGGSYGETEDVELIINGDCFEFLFMQPHERHGATYPTTALAKLEKVIAAHRPFFDALQRFISQPGRHVTFITGNHDVELGFEAVRDRIYQAIHKGSDRKEGVDFCHARFYRPLQDVYIEHGNQHDFWNRICGLWNEQGQLLTLRPGIITLPLGTQYIQHAAYPINVQYPYFDHFEPSMNLTRQVALLCLLNPEIVVSTVHHVIEMLSYSRNPLAGLSTSEERIPVKLFEKAMIDFAAFQEDMVAHSPEFIEPSGQETAQADAMLEFARMREAMSLPLAEAIRAIFSPSIYRMAESTASGMQNILHSDPALRYAIAGHTHIDRVDSINNGSQTYINTGTWTTRYATPGPDEITPELIEWLGKPDWNDIPLRDMTQLVFALIRTEEGAPSSAYLCAWEGGANGTYRVLV
jgi:UDP-2,3-diacylglucosamine pyrophosphatase LpxH